MKLLIVAAIALAAAVAAASPEPRGACLTHPAPLCHTGQRALCYCPNRDDAKCGWVCVAR